MAVRLSNVDIWNALRGEYPSFRSITSQGTAQLFTDKGFEELKQDINRPLNDFFTLSMQVFLQQVNVAKVVDTLAEADFGEYYENALGGIIQRMAIHSVNPISPAYKNLQNGSSPDPFVVRKPKVSERFYDQNYDYQSLVTIQDDFAMKQIFISQYGMSEFMGGIMQGLENGYIAQTFVNKLEAINAALNSSDHPLKNSQEFVVKYTTGTQDENRELWLTLKNLVDAMVMGPSTRAFNVLNFDSKQDKARLRMLIRPGYRNTMTANLLSVIYGADRLNFEIDIIEVPHFGGLTPTIDNGSGTLVPLTSTFNSLGEHTGYTSPGTGIIELDDNRIVWSDPNEDVIAVIADKGFIFHSRQNPYTVEPIRNPRGLYTNYWASSPNNTIKVDNLYNIAVVRKVDVLPEGA